MLISIYDSLTSSRTVASPSQQSVAACREIPAQLSEVQVRRSGSITEPHVDISLLRKYIMHLRTHIVQGDSVARGPKLLSTKNYVIEIMN